MKNYTGFEEVTGECLASCGGDSIEGHASDCELGEMVDDLAALRAQNAELIAALEIAVQMVVTYEITHPADFNKANIKKYKMT